MESELDKNYKQPSIANWTEKDGGEQSNILSGGSRLDTTLTVPVQKKPPPKEPARRVRGKLSKKEQKAMKSSHKDIGWLLAPPPTRETVIHEKAMEKETEDMEIVDEEREARMESRPNLQRYRDGIDGGGRAGV